MNSLHALQTYWFYILAALFAVYTLLDGFDLGVGMFFGLRKSDDERRALMTAVSPFWDGNEVWLLTAGASLFAAFPFVFAAVMSALYPVIMAAVLALILRAVSFEFWHHDQPRRRLWAALFSLCSLLIPLVLGILLGNVIMGMHVDRQGNIMDSHISLLRPFPVALGVLSVCAALLHGTAFTAMKCTGALRDAAFKLGSWLWIPVLALLALVVILAVTIIPGAGQRPVLWAGAAIAAASLAGVLFFAGRKLAGPMFAGTALLMAGLWTFIAGVHFPNLVRAINVARLGMTVYNSSSSILTLQVTAVCVVTGAIITAGYTVLVYRIFRGAASSSEEGY